MTICSCRRSGSSRALGCVLLLPALLAGACASGVRAEDGSPTDRLNVVPWPKSVKFGSGSMPLRAAARIAAADEKLLPLAKIYSEEVFLVTGLRLPAVQAKAGPGDISLEFDGQRKNEDYVLTVGDRAIVRGANYNAVAMGTVTLLQVMRARGPKVSVPKLTIEDGPRLRYCGALLDIARKPHSIETLRQCVIAARFYKIRYFHLHMSDENAWTFPSKAFPQLGKTNFAWAGGKKPTVYDPQELKDLVAFADARGVTFVPEMETPGHSGALRSSLPEIFGYKDASGKLVGRGVINMAGEKAYETLDTLVGEISDVFKSSPYFHIGCDEASLGGIEDMPEVKAVVQREKLPYPHAIFNYYIRRMHKIVKKHGKEMIVWQDAPLHPTAPEKDLIVMAWRGGSGAAAGLVKAGYRVINAPWGVEKPYHDVYRVNGAQLRHGEPLLLGATALSWQATEDNALPFMRKAALLNEPVYNPEANRGLKDFLLRQAQTEPLLDKLVNGFTFRVEGLLSPFVFNRLAPMFTRSLTLTLETSLAPSQVHYTLDGSKPTRQSPRYAQPIRLAGSATLRARWFAKDGKGRGRELTRGFRKLTAVKHDAVGALVEFTSHKKVNLGSYHGPGPKGMTDGMLAAGDSCGEPGWVGFQGPKPIVITIDMGQVTKITRISPRSVRSGGGLDVPARATMELSDDGKVFRKVAEVGREYALIHRGWYTADLTPPEKARYVRVTLTPHGEWTFIDEVMVNAPPPGPSLRHEAFGRKVRLAQPPAKQYAAPGIEGLTDGYVSATPHCGNLEWLGWYGKNIDATIDLGKPTAIREVGANFMQFVWAGIYVPGKTDVSVSDDGKRFRKVATIVSKPDNRGQYVKALSAKLTDVTARHVRLVAYTNGLWLFTNEIFVNPEAPGTSRRN